MEVSGAELGRAFYDDVVAPVLAARWPGLPHAAGRLGSGSDVLGYDDDTSRDHDWGLRLTLLVAEHRVSSVDASLEAELPDAYGGWPTRFATTWDPQVRQRVDVADVGSFVRSRTGLDVSGALSVADWLSVTGQAVLEVTAGPVYVDTAGDLARARALLAWYPDDVWRYVVATDWARLGQELPFVGRAADGGDELGSRVIAARLADVVIHLAHLLDRRWQPYPKWAGTSLAHLPRGHVVADPLRQALAADHWQAREEGLVVALRLLADLQRDVGLPAVDDPIEPFFDRPYRSVSMDVVDRLEASIADDAVRALPRGIGSAEQWSHNVDVLTDPQRRLSPPQ